MELRLHMNQVFFRILKIRRVFFMKEMWCEHTEKVSKYIIVDYEFGNLLKKLRIQSWLCPECGTHGAKSELLVPVSLTK
jgi:hypothetical protein